MAADWYLAYCSPIHKLLQIRIAKKPVEEHRDDGLTAFYSSNEDRNEVLDTSDVNWVNSTDDDYASGALDPGNKGAGDNGSM